MYLEEYRQYRAIALKKLYTSQELIGLILNEAHTTINGKALVFQNIFPYAFVPETTTETKTYVSMSIAVPRVRDKTYKSLSLWIYICMHTSLINTDRGLRYDLMAEVIDRMFNGSLDFGLGRLELRSVEDIAFQSSRYFGIALQYNAADFNRKNGI